MSEKPHDLQSFLESFKKRQEHPHEPGYWVGGNEQRLDYGRGARRWGWFLVVSSFGVLASGILDYVHGSLIDAIAKLVIAGFVALVGAGLIRRSKKPSSKA